MWGTVPFCMQSVLSIHFISKTATVATSTITNLWLLFAVLHYPSSCFLSSSHSHKHDHTHKQESHYLLSVCSVSWPMSPLLVMKPGVAGCKHIKQDTQQVAASNDDLLGDGCAHDYWCFTCPSVVCGCHCALQIRMVIPSCSLMFIYPCFWYADVYWYSVCFMVSYV